jgi:DNA-binding transcriptional LysR family regulator
MELTDLRHFRNVARAGSFTRGARASFVTPPAVSKSIRKLEDELGVPLFARTTRRVALTHEGTALLARCDRIFDELDDLRASLSASTAIEGDLRIGAMEVLSIALLPRALGRMLRAHPAFRPLSHELTPAAMANALREGRIDVGLTIGNVVEPGLVAHELGRSRGVLVCGASHPLRRKKRVTARDVATHPSVVPRFLGLEHQPPIDQFPDLAWPRAIGATIELLQMGVALVETGAVLGYFPEISVRSAIDARRLFVLDGLPPRPPFVLHALLPAHARRRPSIVALLDAIEQEIAAAGRR